jgi:lambda family phage portal protein
MSKQNFLDKFISFVSPETGLQRKYYKDRLEFAYDAARNIPNHSSMATSFTTAASESLSNQRDRIKMMWEARNLSQNFSFFKSILQKEAMYVCGSIRYQAQTGDPEIDKAYEEFWKNWEKNCDITGRYPFRHLIQLAHIGMRRDGDAGFVLVSQENNPMFKLQPIEADRIGNPSTYGKTSKDKENNYIGGITINDYGQPVSYRVFKRTLHGQYKDPKEVPSKNFIHYIDPMRIDQYRGITAFETAIPHAKDIHELYKMEKLAVKWGASHAGVITKNDHGPDKWTTKQTGGLAKDSKKLEKIEPGKIVRLNPGDDINMFPNQTRPSPTFNGFVNTLVREMAHGLNLPYAFVWDMSAFGGATARLEVQQAQRAFRRHQDLLTEQVLDPIKNAVLQRAIFDPNSPLPFHANFKKGKWQFNSQITADLGHEVQANMTMLDAGLKTHESIFGEHGLDFEEESEKTAKELMYLQDLAYKYGIPMSLLSKRLEGAHQMIDAFKQGGEEQGEEGAQ